MALADAAAPERVVGAIGQERVAVQTVDREQARIPTARDERRLASAASSSVDSSEMLGDVRVRVEAVDDVVPLSVMRRLLGQVSRATAADDEHADVVGLAILKFFRAAHRSAFELSLDRGGVASRENASELHVVVLRDCQLDATTKIAVPENANADCHVYS